MMTSDGATSLAVVPPRRKPSWRERENNRKRERRRRAISGRIFAGLRSQGNYNLHKHCDNNEVLKALCMEAGWIVEEDGTTYRKGFKPPPDLSRTFTRVTPYSYLNHNPLSSFFPSPPPVPSYQAIPSSSYFPNHSRIDIKNPSPIFPCIQYPFPPLPPLRISNSAPVTPPTSSPTSTNPTLIPTWGSIPNETMISFDYPFHAVSAPSSPTQRQFHTPPILHECYESDSSTVDSDQWRMFYKIAPSMSMFMQPASPTFNLVEPVVVAQQTSPSNGVMMKEMGTSSEFQFENTEVKPWEGEKIHEEGLDDLELTIGRSSARN